MSAGEGTEAAAPAGAELRLVGLHEIDAVWPLLADGMKEACRRSGDDLTPWFLLQSARRGDALMFVIVEGGVLKAGLVARPEAWGGRQVLRILALTGQQMERWLPLLRAHRQWCEALGVEAVVFEGRLGWQRAVTGARVVRVIYEVELNDGKV